MRILLIILMSLWIVGAASSRESFYFSSADRGWKPLLF